MNTVSSFLFGEHEMLTNWEDWEDMISNNAIVNILISLQNSQRWNVK